MSEPTSEDNSIEDVVEDNVVGPKIEADPVAMDLDRQRAMLTRTDRELLIGRKNYDSEQVLRNAKYRIREHIRNSIDDVMLINNTLSLSEFRQIEHRQKKLYREGEVQSPSFADPAVELGLRFAYVQATEIGEYTFEELVEELTKYSVRSILTTLEDSLIENVDVNVSVQKTGLQDELLTELVSGTTSMNRLILYLSNPDSDTEKLRNKLQEHSTSIETKDAGAISPEGELFEQLVSKYSVSNSTDQD